MTEWAQWLRSERGVEAKSYDDLWRWSVEDLEGFWESIWTYFELIGHSAPMRILEDRPMPGAKWFPGATLNWAENIMRRLPSGVAVIGQSQTRATTELTGPELADSVARARFGLVALGVKRGDRVAAYLPNIAEAVILLLACASLGAVFSSCPPEFGIKGVIDRFGQIEPTILVTVDGYRHKGRPIDRAAEIAAIRNALPTLRATVLVPYLSRNAELADSTSWPELLSHPAEPLFEAVPFDHPLYILYTSGTTGLPKPIVHSHGGILLEHTKLHHLHHDLRPGDRFFWFATTGWVMWNYLVSGLLTGSAIVLFDGDPGYPNLDVLWQLASDVRVTVFGVSAPFLLSCRKAEMNPGRDWDLTCIRQLGSTGAPLPAIGAEWVYERVNSNLLLISACGGTDVATAFVAGTLMLPVVAGEIACRCLGVKVEAFDQSGLPVVGRPGELVITRPMPSMPVYLWGDHAGERYHHAYFERFPNVWAHGDWITITERGTCIITGRSDATLNRGGVRLGTSDFYSVIEDVPGIIDSLVVHLEDPEGGLGELLLFVQLAENVQLANGPEKEIRSRLRSLLSPRHDPDVILSVPSIPRTLSGKKLEIPIKRILTGVPLGQAASTDMITDPQSLLPFVSLFESRQKARNSTAGDKQI
jgi:acetoacetyl-CoA synthetase